MRPVFGLFKIGFTGQRNAALYSLVVAVPPVRARAPARASPFGLSLALDPGEPAARRRARHLDARRMIAIYAPRGRLCGRRRRAARADHAIVSLDLFDFHRSADVMLMLIIGGAGYLYGGLIGAAIFIVPEGRHLRRDAGILGVLDRRAAGRAGAGRARAVRGRARTARLRARPRRERAMSAPALEARGLVRRFGGLVATDNVSFRSQPGARQALIGPNGAGKTTLINLLTGVVKPTEGAVCLEGENVTPSRPAGACAAAWRAPSRSTSSFPTCRRPSRWRLAISERHGRGADSCARGGRRADRRRDRGTARALRVDPATWTIRPIRLPYGKQRLLEIALALACRPRVLLLDEPAAGVPEERTARHSRRARRPARATSRSC